MEFLKGNTDPVGDCGNFGAGIDVHGADQFPNDSKKRTWYSRIECYGSTAEQAEELRDKVLALLVAPTPPQPIPVGSDDSVELRAELALAKRYLHQALAAHNPRSRLSCDIRRLLGLNPMAPKVTPDEQI